MFSLLVAKVVRAARSRFPVADFPLFLLLGVPEGVDLGRLGGECIALNLRSKSVSAPVLQLGGSSVILSLDYFRNNEWRSVPLSAGESGFVHQSREIVLTLRIEPEPNGYSYRLEVEAQFHTRVRLRLRLAEEGDCFHLIPCNIHGDNNLSVTGPGEYPHLTDRFHEDPFCAPLWELRADRAALPVSILCHGGGAIGISIEPYSEQAPGREMLNDRGFLRNGVFAELPCAFGVSLGYGNEPGSFVEKQWLGAPTCHLFRKASASGRILAFSGDRRAAHGIVRELYAQWRKVPCYRKTAREAIAGLMDAWLHVNWGPVSSLGGCEYYRNGGFAFDDGMLRDGRPLCEIGWTAGGPMLHAFALGASILGLGRETFGHRKDAADLIDMIVGAYNPASGFFNELTLDWKQPKPFWDKIPLEPASRNNGWWAGYIVGNQHTAYNNGNACFYILKTIGFWRQLGVPVKPEWMETVLKVLATVLKLQRGDGSYGYAYSEKAPKVDIWEGFAGCWFAAACAWAARLTGESRYIDSARRGIAYYHRFVRELNCYGTPMDTYMSVDMEGVLAFIRACRALHEATGDDALLAMMGDGAEYEYLWRYGFEARPEYAPLKGCGWNSCGGSVTSVSNPHIHPMGLTIVEDLHYLARRTGDPYHRQRAEDSLAWAMQCLELYPKIAQCGSYGVMTERFCPSDGLVVEKNRDGSPYSMWRCYNGWAAAAVLEGIGADYLTDSPLLRRGLNKCPVSGADERIHS